MVNSFLFFSFFLPEGSGARARSITSRSETKAFNSTPRRGSASMAFSLLAHPETSIQFYIMGGAGAGAGGLTLRNPPKVGKCDGSFCTSISLRNHLNQTRNELSKMFER